MIDKAWGKKTQVVTQSRDSNFDSSEDNSDTMYYQQRERTIDHMFVDFASYMSKR